MSTRLYPSRVEVASDEAIVASHARVANHGHICYDWQHYIALIQRKPGALRNGAPFADMPVPLQRLRQGLMQRDGGDKIMVQICCSRMKINPWAIFARPEQQMVLNDIRTNPWGDE